MRRLLSVGLLLVLPACTPAQEDETRADIVVMEEAAQHRVHISVRVPDGSGPVYLSGNLSELGPWAADGLLMSGEGRLRSAEIDVPHGHVFEYKVTLGTWDREGVADPAGVPRNFQLLAHAAGAVEHTIDHWKREPAFYLDTWQDSGVLGRLIYWRDVESAHLDSARHVEIWLPPGYDESDRDYPVIYMHDGQNLFDPRIANTGVDWGVDEAIVRGMETGRIRPAIVVGIWTGSLRGRELSPWDLGDAYARFLVEELKPRIDAEFRTLPGPANTMTMGSSMGGLISLHLVRMHPDVFGACGCLSTHFPLSPGMAAEWFGAELAGGVDPDQTYIEAEIAAGAVLPDTIRLWFDYGTETLDAIYEPSHLVVRDWVLAQGFEEGEDFVMRRYDGAAHNEASWRSRLDDPLEFLLGSETP